MASQLGTTPDQIVTQVAQQLGVPVGLALAMMQQESGGNPNAVGDNGSSFGLFQLHEGGELGSMSPQSVMGSPQGMYQNALTALTQLKQVMDANPGANPGMLAALAQRPANEGQYAASIDQIMGAPDSIGGNQPWGSYGSQGTGTSSLMSQLLPSIGNMDMIDPQLQAQLNQILGMQGMTPYSYGGATQSGQAQYDPIQLMDYTQPSGPGGQYQNVIDVPGQGGLTNPGGQVTTSQPSLAQQGAMTNWGPAGPPPGWDPNTNTIYGMSPQQMQQNGINPYNVQFSYAPYQDIFNQAAIPQENIYALKNTLDTQQATNAQQQANLSQTANTEGYQNTLAQLGLEKQAAGIQGGALARQGALLPQENQLQQQLFGLQGQAIGAEEQMAQYQSGLQQTQFQGGQAASGAWGTPSTQTGLSDIANQLAYTMGGLGRAQQQLGVSEQQYGLNYNEQLAQLQDAIKNLGLTTGPGGYLDLQALQALQGFQNTGQGNALGLISTLEQLQSASAQNTQASAGVQAQANANTDLGILGGSLPPVVQGSPQQKATVPVLPGQKKPGT